VNGYTFQLLPELFSKFVKEDSSARSVSRNNSARELSRRASERSKLEGGNDSRGNNFQREFEKF
jgi:hypothetical protein